MGALSVITTSKMVISSLSFSQCVVALADVGCIHPGLTRPLSSRVRMASLLLVKLEEGRKENKRLNFCLRNVDLLFLASFLFVVPIESQKKKKSASNYSRAKGVNDTLRNFRLAIPLPSFPSSFSPFFSFLSFSSPQDLVNMELYTKVSTLLLAS